MRNVEQSILRRLADLAAAVSEHSYAPYSGAGCGCVLLLSDGTWVPGVRVENASFPLLISATMNAVTTALAAGRNDLVAAVCSRKFGGAERDYLSAFLPSVTFAGTTARTESDLPEVGERLNPVMIVSDTSDGAISRLTREATSRAHVPESDFPVGCILETANGGLIPGCNVEHENWNLSLCAERNALGTAISYGLSSWRRLYLFTSKESSSSPCGACRQVIVEHAPHMPLVMDRGAQPPEVRTGADLLPNYFAGAVLRKKPSKNAS